MSAGVVLLLVGLSAFATRGRNVSTLLSGAVAASSVGGQPSCAPSTLNRSDVLPDTGIAVSPMPGSLDASPATQISLLGEPAAVLSDVEVTGSKSGAHSGQLEAYSQGDGASFVPDKPFTAGELVMVTGDVAQHGVKHQFAYQFTVSTPDPIPTVPPGKRPANSAGELQSFHSRPDLRPPAVDVTVDKQGVAPGYIFASPYSGPGQNGPMIFDNSGQLIWFHPIPYGTESTNLQVQTYAGSKVLTWWEGYIPPEGFGEGAEVIANSAYREIATVKAGNGFKADLHDFLLSKDNIAYLTVFNPLQCNLSALGGPADGNLTDGVFEELDVKTGLVRREWHSLDHVSVRASHQRPTYATAKWPDDYFHINSIAIQPDGNLLISSRSTWALFSISTKTDQVVTEVGGKNSSLSMGPGTKTAWQHDANVLPNGDITVFDNGATPVVHNQSRGVVEKINPTTKTVTLLTEFEHPKPIVSFSQGDFQTLSNGDAFVGWGAQPYFSEFNKAGQLVFDAHMRLPNQSYRSYRFTWVGNPEGPPAITAQQARLGRHDDRLREPQRRDADHGLARARRRHLDDPHAARHARQDRL